MHLTPAQQSIIDHNRVAYIDALNQLANDLTNFSNIFHTLRILKLALESVHTVIRDELSHRKLVAEQTASCGLFSLWKQNKYQHKLDDIANHTTTVFYNHAIRSAEKRCLATSRLISSIEPVLASTSNPPALAISFIIRFAGDTRMVLGDLSDKTFQALSGEFQDHLDHASRLQHLRALANVY